MSDGINLAVATAKSGGEDSNLELASSKLPDELIATYKTADDMPEKLRKALPPVEDLRKLLDGTDTK